MNSNPINSGAINAFVGFAAIVYLPSAAATVELGLNERISVTLEGSTGSSFGISGDISKVSNLGNALNSSGFTVTGDLTQFRKSYFDPASTGFDFSTSASLTLSKTIYIGDSQTGFSIDPSGLLQTVSQLPAGSSGFSSTFTAKLQRMRLMDGVTGFTIEPASNLVNKVNFGNQVINPNLSLSGILIANRFLSGSADSQLNTAGDLAQGVRVSLGGGSSEKAIELTGALRKTSRMAGAIAVSLAPTGSLSRGVQVPIEAAPVVVSMSTQAALRANYRMQGVADVVMAPSAQIALIRRLEGSTGITTSLQGDLANNAQAADLDALLMIRKPVNREMTR